MGIGRKFSLELKVGAETLRVGATVDSDNVNSYGNAKYYLFDDMAEKVKKLEIPPEEKKTLVERIKQNRGKFFETEKAANSLYHSDPKKNELWSDYYESDKDFRYESSSMSDMSM